MSKKKIKLNKKEENRQNYNKKGGVKMQYEFKHIQAHSCDA
jgi:hypothetical protein